MLHVTVEEREVAALSVPTRREGEPVIRGGVSYDPTWLRLGEYCGINTLLILVNKANDT